MIFIYSKLPTIVRKKYLIYIFIFVIIDNEHLISWVMPLIFMLGGDVMSTKELKNLLNFLLIIIILLIALLFVVLI